MTIKAILGEFVFTQSSSLIIWGRYHVCDKMQFVTYSLSRLSELKIMKFQD